MSAGKLHTRQYACAGMELAPRRKRLGKHLGGAALVIAAASLCAWHSRAVAYADTNREREACALMSDYAAAIHWGYGNSSLHYAYAVLSREMPAEDAAHLLYAATRDQCPDHAADLPAGWR
ncbi:hypothetical protein ACX9NE_25100 [Mycobacterium sp. ML4]